MSLSLTSSHYLVFLILLPLLLLLPLIYLLYQRHDRPCKKLQPRGEDDLKSYPLLGRLPHLVKNQHRLLEWSVHVARRSPTHTATFKAAGLPGVVITTNHENLEHIAKTSFANYPKGDYLLSTIRDLLGHGLFNSDGDQWLWQRKAASYEFSKRSLRKFIADTVRSEVVGRLLPLLEQAAAGRRTLDMQRVFECFAFDNICHVAFGEDPACLGAMEGTAATPPPASVEFMRAFDDVQNAMVLRFRPPESMLWRLKRMLGIGSERQVRLALDVVRGYADTIVRRCRERGGSSRGDFLAHLVAARGDDLSQESLRDVVTNFLLAGRDTTSSALTWFFWLVSGRPDVEDKIVREVRALRSSSIHGGGGGGGTGTATTTATFSLDELREMHYIHAAITESMRLYPPVGMGMHCSKRDDRLPDGTFVGKGWVVNHSMYAMARLESLWGEDCEEFRPERWLREDGTFQPESPAKYPVFHVGPRMCLGKEMAYIQMKSIVSSVFERFSFRFLGGEERPGLDLSFTLRMKGGLPMQVTKRPAGTS
ncbi:cytochrome P450 94C1-like [Panicum virgatum]|uniref:Uncharacterized protein n=1 Tax=Panicum virgatum TaxID=38727 RepID=A0A8T0NKR0_PANVG|nr:cytochrome P450 94C1-like [Panicum virgatum]KAG2547696.1 hypothetical protein PVAP13_9KG116900 [Panicum virgatum]